MAGDGLIANGVNEILKRLSILVAKETASVVHGAHEQFLILKKTLDIILAVMGDAGKKEMISEGVRIWLEELKDIAYEVEDILDEHAHEVLQRQMSRKRDRVSYSFSPYTSIVFRHQIAYEIKVINKKLSEHVILREVLGLQKLELGRNSGPMYLDESSKPREVWETDSIVDPSLKIIGRDKDKSNIIKMLLGSKNRDGNIQVIPIVGMGGVGKTTLTRSIFNDKTVGNHFDLKLWVCVSDEFNVKKLFVKIIESINKDEKCDDVSNIDVIACKLQQCLREKKYLLVLDDVWNKNYVEWLRLKKPLLTGGNGSKILVTTRSEEVASIMGDKLQSYQLGILDEDQSWSLFHERTFGYSGGAVETPIMREIGKELVKKCGGLPLAIMNLVGLLRYKNENEWGIINKSEPWKHRSSQTGILPILKLSYDHLPFHLKQCFTYFLLFGKDYTFDPKTMISFWMAEGFLPQPYGGNIRSMEEVGNTYFNSLLHNSFFQDVEKDEFGQVVSFKMHNLVHDLAKYVADEDEYFVLHADDLMESIPCVRHLQLISFKDEINFNEINNPKLRTLIVHNESIKKIENNAFEGIKRLRVLDLHNAPDIEEISSSSMRNLKHLRYLDLKGTKIKRLPESIKSLYHLQTLDLMGCENLKELPEGIGKLINLRHLLLPEDINMSREIGQLTSLQTLLRIDVGNKGGVTISSGERRGSIEVLGGLNLLSGQIVINNLRNVTSGTDAQQANLKRKKNLNVIFLNWHTDDAAREDDIEGGEYNYDEAVLEALEPHPNLKMLVINQYFGVKLPLWMRDPWHLPNLVILSLNYCRKCEQVVGFGKLPSLEELRLLNMDRIKCLGKEFSDGEVVLFPSLKKLVLQDMASLEVWVDIPSTISCSCFTCLENIYISGCPNLKITPTRFPSLKELTLQNINERVVLPLITTNLNSLQSVDLWGIEELMFLPHCLLQGNNLKELKVFECEDFQGFLPNHLNQEEDRLWSLNCLVLVHLPALKFLPDIRSLPSLEELDIRDCASLKLLPEDLTCLSSCLEHLRKVVVENVKEVEDFKYM